MRIVNFQNCLSQNFRLAIIYLLMKVFICFYDSNRDFDSNCVSFVVFQ